jgi:galactoside O-acetyltransferase|tara:strand:+ start:98 stop:697 length:600 start_codon:yes stop_codon:yes gene_type:complete
MFFRKIYVEVIRIFFTFSQFFPGKTGDILRRLTIVNFFKKKGSNISLRMGVEITGFKNIEIGNNVFFERYSSINANDGDIKIGNNVSFNYNTNINASDKGIIEIGNDVTVGQNTVIRASDHEYKNINVPIKYQGHTGGKIIIGNGVWVGANCVITRNTKIGNHSIVNAGSIITRDVDAYSIVGGNPAKLIKKLSNDRKN